MALAHFTINFALTLKTNLGQVITRFQGWVKILAYNYFRTFYARTVAEEPRYHGQVHIMAVNTESQFSLHGPVSGSHWLLAAWYLEPQVAPYALSRCVRNPLC